MGMKVYVIMGVHNTRKSSTIRSLTGVAKQSVYNVALEDGKEIPILIFPQALQEGKISPDEFIKEVKNQLKNKKFETILIALRLTGIKKCLNGIDYLETFKNEKWEIAEPLVLLGKLLRKKDKENLKKMEEHSLKIYRIEESFKMASNKIASKIRELWGWM